MTELYEFESSYIDTHGLSAAGKKKDAVWKQLEQVLKDLNKIQSEFLRYVYKMCGIKSLDYNALR